MWHIRQEIVCIRTHRDYGINEGEFYSIIGISTTPCRCKIIIIDVGIKVNSERLRCDCGHTWESHGIAWTHEHHFAPLSEISEVHEALAKEPFTV